MSLQPRRQGHIWAFCLRKQESIWANYGSQKLDIPISGTFLANLVLPLPPQSGLQMFHCSQVPMFGSHVAKLQCFPMFQCSCVFHSSRLPVSSLAFAQINPLMGNRGSDSCWPHPSWPSAVHRAPCRDCTTSHSAFTARKHPQKSNTRPLYLDSP